jgi:hypothetical protein
MRNFLDAKTMAKTLREALAARNVSISHSECLELVARQFGLTDWNTLAARIVATNDTNRVLPLPRGWVVTSHTDLKNYRAGLDPSARGMALIESKLARESGVDLSDNYAVLMQSIVADAYRGGKAKLTASIRTEDADTGTLWMRVDRAPGSAIRFDNMMKRSGEGPLKGTRGWAQRTIVLEVPDEATSIHYGFFLQGYGRVWARDFQLESVSSDIETTECRAHLPKPTNLDFSALT